MPTCLSPIESYNILFLKDKQNGDDTDKNIKSGKLCHMLGKYYLSGVGLSAQQDSFPACKPASLPARRDVNGE
jgi:hypothetical protein